MTRDGADGAAREWLFDASVAVVLTALLVPVTAHLTAPAGGRPVDLVALGLVVVAGAAMGGWRRAPRTMLAVVVVVLGCYVGLWYPNGPVLATGWLALLAVSWRTDRRTALIGAAGLCVVLGVAAPAGGRGGTVPLFFLGWSAAAVFLGDALRNRRDRLQERDRARERETRRLLTEERLRIARDLHDSVAHAMATINVQAGAAAHVIDRRPEAAKGALVAIQRASGDVLEELAAMLALLRDAGEGADRAPTAGLDDIGQLAETSRAAGLAVSITVDGVTGSVPRPIGTAAYRIVQESLTNVIRHAGATAARVTVRAGADRSLAVEVTDDGVGAGRPAGGTGTGILGMRERAESTGGRLAAGPGPDGGYRVRATWARRG